MAVFSESRLFPQPAKLIEFGEIDARLPSCFVRIVMAAAVRPRRSENEATNRRASKNFNRRIANVIAAEKRWLGGERAEPRWPKLPAWPSRRRRVFRIGAPNPEDLAVRRPTEPPAHYVDEHAIGALVTGISGFVRETPGWVLELAGHPLNWTIEANNGPPGDRTLMTGRTGLITGMVISSHSLGNFRRP
jgi:hypothetical protein